MSVKIVTPKLLGVTPTVAFKTVLKPFQFKHLKKRLPFLNCISWLSFMHAHRPETAACFARNACRDHLAEQRTSEHQAAPLEHVRPSCSPGERHCAPLHPLAAATVHQAPPQILQRGCVLTPRGIRRNSLKPVSDEEPALPRSFTGSSCFSGNNVPALQAAVGVLLWE